MPPACCALQACMEGFEVADIESVVGEVDFLTSATGNFDTITLAHMKKMRIDAIVGKSVTSTTKSSWPVSRASLASRWKHRTTGGPVRLPRWARRLEGPEELRFEHHLAGCCPSGQKMY